MPPDVVDFSAFYDTRLGQTARHLIRRSMRRVWPDLGGLSLLGLGHATPLLRPFLAEAERVVALMPASQGVMAWPPQEPRLVTLADDDDLPLPDESFDRVIILHALEFSEQVDPMLREVWRVMSGEGRLLAIVPNRAGLWARIERTPFGHGRPYSPSQLTRLLRDNLFTPTSVSAALYFPPSRSRMMLRTARAWEQVGRKWGGPFSGLLLVEAAKQVYSVRPESAGARTRRRIYLPIPGGHAPEGARVTGARVAGARVASRASD
ncbi:MAG: methyltransferase domain-containing protein [Alphaproteobacteria bacterium]